MPENQKTLAEVPVTAIKGVGEQVAAKLERLGVFNLQGLLFNLPFRYQDRTKITPIGALQLNAHALIEGEIKASDIVFGRRRSLVCRVQDNTGSVTLRFFHFSAAQKNQLTKGVRMRCFGEARRGASGLEIYHPEYEIVSQSDSQRLDLQQRLTPIYNTTEGLTQPRLRKITRAALDFLRQYTLPDLLPRDLVPEKLSDEVDLKQLIRFLHEPDANVNVQSLIEGVHPFQQRLAFEELVAHNLSLLKARRLIKQQSSCCLKHDKELEQRFVQGLGFTLTNSQKKVAEEISRDLHQSSPMLRLVQGDVGSGKTVVAALAALHAVSTGKQVALMAPTEILAGQHFQSFAQWFEKLNIHVAFLTGSLKQSERKQQLTSIANGEAAVIIGTHALFQDEVDFHNLALVIIDEQHRFGVHQRFTLAKKSKHAQPHQLIMTATPIPRTLAMSVYADLDCSIIDELPPGRTPVNTVLIDNERRPQVVERLRAACSEGKQAYWVCTLIEESEESQCEAAETTASQLAKLLPAVNVGLVHGRLKPAEKNRVMAAFKAGEIQLLVATTVIEVGVDVPNASLMIIENPERLGLSQLHQLRGRVGRGSEESHCVLLYATPLSKTSKERLAVMRETTDGFLIAEKDLEIRGPGEVLGTRQTGDISFHIANLQRDAHLLTDVKKSAARLAEEHPELAEKLIDRWVGRKVAYVQA